MKTPAPRKKKTKAVRDSATSAHPSTLGAENERQIRVINAESGPPQDAATLISPPSLDEMLAWLDDLRERSEFLDDSTPAKAWDLMLRAFALASALKSPDAHPEFRATATANLQQLVRELKAMGLRR